MNKLAPRTWAQIDLDAIAHNIKAIRDKLSSNTKIMCVVKADAYGHGYLQSSMTMIENGADYLGVAFIDEGEQLRSHGIECPILILGYTAYQDMERLIDSEIIPTIYNYDDAVALSEIAVSKGRIAKIHIKVDTGMSRLGFMWHKPSSLSDIERIYNLDGIEIEGIFSHLSRADEKDETFSYIQFERFMEFCYKLEQMGIKIPIKHLCNSAATIRFKEMHLDMVRTGIITYGLCPNDDLEWDIDLKAAMSVRSTITRIEEITTGTRVSYGGIYMAPHDIKVATIPIGYADGYLRCLENKAKMIAGEVYSPVIGRICMDQCMIDVTNVNNINVADEVVIFGKSECCEITVDEVAKIMGTINYEVLCVIGKRVPRVYVANGKKTNILNYLI